MRSRNAIARADRTCNGRTDGRTNEDGTYVAQRILRFRNARARVQDFCNLVGDQR